MRDTTSLYGRSVAELQTFLALERPYQATQIYQWLIKGVSEFDEMTNLPKSERQRLEQEFGSALSTVVISTDIDSASGAAKLGIQTNDGLIVEAVLLIDENNRATACLSSQVGCAQGCTFCNTATMGFLRNLSAAEIIEQYVHLQRISKESITHLVYMGMGEPLANTSEVLASIAYFHDPAGFNIGLRRITISTCGLVPGIQRLAEEEVGVRLAISLVAADDRLRSKIMPVNKRYNTHQLADALRAYQRKVGKRITIEYCMLSGVNTSEADAYKLATWLEGIDALVNLIAWNPVESLPYESPSEAEISAFSRTLDALRISYTHRRSRGQAIDGACGQLAVPLHRAQKR